MPTVDIKSLRINRGLSIRAAARDMGVSVNTLTRAENGETRPRPDAAKRIAEFYGYLPLDLWPLEDPSGEPVAA